MVGVFSYPCVQQPPGPALCGLMRMRSASCTCACMRQGRRHRGLQGAQESSSIHSLPCAPKQADIEEVMKMVLGDDDYKAMGARPPRVRCCRPAPPSPGDIIRVASCGA